MPRWTEQGDGYRVGSTQAGRRIDFILDALRRFQREAQAVAVRLAAEAQLAQQRWTAVGFGAAGYRA